MMTKRISTCLTGLAVLAGTAVAQDQSKQPPISKEQRDAILKVQTAAQANNWDGVIQAVTQVLENFPETPFKHRLIFNAMQAAQNENNYEQTVVWGDRAIQDDPTDVVTKAQLASAIAVHIRENDLDRDQSVKKVNDYANQVLTSLQSMNTAPASAPLNEPSQWPALKQELIGQANYALASAAEVQKNYTDAQKYFQAAITVEPANATYYARLSKTDISLKQYDDAITAAQKALDMPNAPAPVKQFAQAQKDRATALKAAAPK